MKFILLIILSFSSLIENNNLKEEDDIFIINNSNMPKIIEKYPCLLVNFFDPWCPHCEKFEPEFKKLAKILKEEKSFIRLGSVDSVRQTYLDDLYKIKEYPTLKIFSHGNIFTYIGKKEIGPVRKWLKKKCEIPAVYIGTENDLKKLTEENDVAVLGLFRDMESENVKVFNKISRLIDGAYFGITSRKKIFEKFNINKKEAVVLIKKFDEGKNIFEDNFKEKELTDFINLNKLPLICDFNEKNAQNLFSSEIKTHSVLLISRNNTKFGQLFSEFKEAAKNFRGKVLFVLLDVDLSENSGILDFFEFKPSDQPAVRLVSLKGNMTQYKPSVSEINSKSIVKFVNEIIEYHPYILEKDEL